MNTLPITTALCGFALGLLLASQCNTGGGVVVGSDTTRTIKTPPSETIAGVPASIEYHLSDFRNMVTDNSKPKTQNPKPIYVRVPVYVHDTTAGRIDSVIDSVFVPSQCEHCRFDAVSDSITTAHGDRMILRYRFPDNTFDIPYFQPAPDTTVAITSYVTVRKNFAAVVGFYGGYDIFAGNISAGISVTVGLKLPEF